MKKILIGLSVALNIVVLACVIFIWSIKDQLLNGMILAHSERLQTQFELLSDKTADIVFTGDSITEGGNWPELFPDVDVVNRGISGDTTTDLLNRIDQVIVLKPQKLFIMIGINDLNKGVEQQLTFANYQTLFDKIDAQLPTTVVHVMSVLPVNDQWMYADNAMVPQLNIELARQAESRGYQFIDLHSVFADDQGKLQPKLSNDGIHLLGEGYHLWRQQISQYIHP